MFNISSGDLVNNHQCGCCEPKSWKKTAQLYQPRETAGLLHCHLLSKQTSGKLATSVHLFCPCANAAKLNAKLNKNTSLGQRLLITHRGWWVVHVVHVNIPHDATHQGKYTCPEGYSCKICNALLHLSSCERSHLSLRQGCQIKKEKRTSQDYFFFVCEGNCLKFALC